MNLGHNYLFHKEFSTVYLGDKDKNMVTLSHIAQRKHAFLGKIKQIPKLKKIAPRKKVAFGIITP